MRAFLPCLLLLAGGLAPANEARGAVEVPCEFRSGLIWLRVTPAGNSTPLAFVLDSGAGASVVDLLCARQLGLRMGERQRVLGVQRTADAWRIDQFAGRIGDLPAPASLLAVDLRSMRRACGGRLDGVLGLDFLRQHIVEVDYAGRRLRFHERGKARPLGERLELVARNDALCVRTVINGAPKLLRVDTGCSSPVEVVADRKTAPPHRALSANVQLGSSVHANVAAGMHAQRFFRGEDGLLGNGLLSRFDVTFDATGEALFLRARSARPR